MSLWGIGPAFVAWSLGYSAVMLTLTCVFYPEFQIEMVPDRVLDVLGCMLIVVGVPFFVVSQRAILRAYEAHALKTDGVYRCCRHPLYAAWVVFIVPGLVLLVKSWLGLTTPVFMYLVLRVLVPKEEAHLEKVFGAEYLQYKKRVPRIVPYGCLLTRD